MSASCLFCSAGNDFIKVKFIYLIRLFLLFFILKNNKNGNDLVNLVKAF
ncbi:hypothetical protein PPHE_b0527 [Pseudoalteromonas phenolica O-BC30]|nr:hypothetical protein [Pseudoalteromonas phenolica O-BC30]